MSARKGRRLSRRACRHCGKPRHGDFSSMCEASYDFLLKAIEALRHKTWRACYERLASTREGDWVMKTYTTNQIIAAAVETAKDEIMTAVRSGTIPEGVTSFAELHDYCDANLLGGASLVMALCGMEDGTDVLNSIQNGLDEWIYRGGITTELVRYGTTGKERRKS